MNARALTTGLGVVAALLLATSSVAFGQAAVNITSPTAGQTLLVTIQDPPVTTRDVTVTVAYTPDPSDTAGLLRFVLDADPGIDAIPAGSPHAQPLIAVPRGSHLLTVYLLSDDGLTVRRVATRRFHVSIACNGDADCVDTDDCSNSACIEDPSLAGSGYFGRCRYGPTDDSDCCMTPEWCRHAGLGFEDVNLATAPPDVLFRCADVKDQNGNLTPDGISECVPCLTTPDCPLYNQCHDTAVCDGNYNCVYTLIPGCCTSDALCSDGNPCTADTCDTVSGTCTNAPIPGCCVVGNDGALPDAPDYGCTPVPADVCINYRCIGVGSDATCRTGPKFRGCCDVDQDCNDAAQLNICTDPTSRGYGTCDFSDPDLGALGFCTYPKADPLCCIKNYECADRYPEFLGYCQAEAGYSYLRCQYTENPDYCESPVDNLVINEIMVDPAGLAVPIPDIVPDFFGEWFELFNPTPYDIDINGWTVEDLGEGDAKQSFTIDKGQPLVVGAGGFVVLARKEHPYSNGGIVGVGYEYFDTDFVFDNLDDEIVLRDGDGVEVDRVEYDETWPYQPGMSMALIHPYLDNTVAAHWGTSSIGYLYARYLNYGTPKDPNTDVLDTSLVGNIACDDGNPCTLDICNLDKAYICSYVQILDCCTAATAIDDCDDGNFCTSDWCEVATNQCHHDPVPGCCTADSQCADYYPTGVDTTAEQEAFDACAVKVCVGGTCRYGRDPGRPGCCVAVDDGNFPCFDRNVCTIDACVADAGLDPNGVPYSQCVFDLDLDSDGINDCCRLTSDCDDHDPSTLDICNMVAAYDPPGVNRCWYKPDPNYCGPGGSNCDDGDPCTLDTCCAGVNNPVAACQTQYRCVHEPIADCCVADAQCVDGQACTQDACCTGPGAPLASCTAANACAHEEVAAGCCETHADCNGGPDNPPCQAGYCIGAVCRYGPQIAGCCVTADDCAPQTCYSYTCDYADPADAHGTCAAHQEPGCCVTQLDCTPSVDPCKSTVCIANQCTEVDVPNCCVDENPAGPDPSCHEDPDNPCTADYCMLSADGFYRCQRYPTGGLGCCLSDAGCVSDGVACTAEVCLANSCELEPILNCQAISPYIMTFSEGHPMYAGEYQTLADIAWTTEDFASPASPFFIFSTAGTQGPDKNLRFLPTATVTTYDSCAVLPRFRSPNTSASVQFNYSAEGVTGAGAELRVLATNTGDWASATNLGTIPLTVDTQTAFETELPAALVQGQIDIMIAICVSGATTDDITAISIDDLALAQGRIPSMAPIADQFVAKGQIITIPDVFVVTEPDTDENITITLQNSPGSWLRVVNVREDLTDPTGQTWKGDLLVNGAVCPAASPYNYSLWTAVSDGALGTGGSFVLSVSGCP